MADIKDTNGRIPLSVRRFFIDKIKFNDNTNNEYSDCYYVANLISCLALTLAASTKPKANYAFSFGEDDEMEVDSEEEQTKTEALNEIERYRRIDEWISSYHNTYTVTAIECIERLIRADVVKNKTADILQYTRPGNADNVRTRAFRALVNLGLAKKPMIIRYLLHSLCDDPSPYMRERLLRVFGAALGSIALWEDEEKKPPVVTQEVDSGLILEQDPTEARPVDFANKTTPEGALEALRVAVATNEVFKAALWDATLSNSLTIFEMVELLDIAALLFEPATALTVVLPLPHYWRVEHSGRGKLRFYQASSYRTKPSKYRPLGVEEWKRVQEYGLQYTGPVAKAAQEQEAREKLDLTAQIAAAQQELQKQEQLRLAKQSYSTSHMSPPPLPTPSEPNVLKLSLKRKQSVDMGRAGSPKVQKTEKAQVVNDSIVVATPMQRSPSASKKRSNTPVIPAPKTLKLSKGKTRIVKLKTTGVQKRIQKILSKTPRPTIVLSPIKGATPRQTPSASDRPLKTSQSPPPIGTNAGLYSSPVDFNSMPSTNTAVNWNVGGFRNFTSSSPAPAPVKTEDNGVANHVPISAISPTTTTPWPASSQPAGGSSPEIPLASLPRAAAAAPPPSSKKAKSKAGTPAPLATSKKTDGKSGSHAGTPAPTSTSTPTPTPATGGGPPKMKFKLKLGSKGKRQGS